MDASLCADYCSSICRQASQDSKQSSREVAYLPATCFDSYDDQGRDSLSKDGSAGWHRDQTAQARSSSYHEYDATCTSRSTDVPCRPPFVTRVEAQGSLCCSEQLLTGHHPQGIQLQQHSWQPSHSNPARQQVLRVRQQQESLLMMIRNELVLEQELVPHAFPDQMAGGAQQITPQMRMIVSSWLSEVACELNMQQETLFLAVAIMDRFLDASLGVPCGVLQLVAVACMLLASKQDEVVHPCVEELTDIAANCFQVQDLLRMERILLDALSWRIKTPTAYTFLHLYTQSTAALRSMAAQPSSCPFGTSHNQDRADAAASSASHEPLSGVVVANAAYLIELALLDHSMLSFRPSQVAAGALLLAQNWSEQGAAVQEIYEISGYGLSDLQGCMSRLLHLHQCAAAAATCESLAPFAFIREKYSQECWLRVSLHEAPLPAAATAMDEPIDDIAPYGDFDSAKAQAGMCAGSTALQAKQQGLHSRIEIGDELFMAIWQQ